MNMLRAAIFCSLLIAGASAAGSYVITAPGQILPGSDYEVSVVILNASNVRVQASLREQGFDAPTGRTLNTPIVNASDTFSSGSPGKLVLRIADSLVVTGSLQLHVRGTGGLQFERTEFISLRRQVVVSLIQTDKAIYKPGQLVRFRLFAVTPDLLLHDGALSYEIRDPNGNKIIVESNVTSETNVVEGSLQLSDQPVFGTWTTEVTFLDVKESSSQTFEVSQYELPPFEVTVEVPPYVLTTDQLITGKIRARYTFGQPVKGFVEIHVGPNQGPDPCGVPPRSTQFGVEIDGEAPFSIPREDINRVVPLFDRREVRITAFVREEATGIRLNGSVVLTFYANEYQVKFTDNTPSVFKAGLEYTAFIQVTTPDNKPPTQTNITASVYTSVTYQLTVDDQALYDVSQFSGNYGLPGQNLTVPLSGLLTVNIDIPKNATSINIKVTVNNVQATKAVEKMFSPSNNYIQVSLLDKNIQSGSSVTVKVDATEPVKQLNYEVLARGSVAVSGVVEGNDRTSFTFELEVTTNFAPTSHLLVYTVRGTDEILADSLAFLVAGIFNNNVTVSFNKNQTEPNTDIIVEATATPGSQVYILVVDQSVLLLKTGNDITPEKVNTAVSKFDDGQKPSDPEFPLSYSATSVREVFSKTGLIVITDVPTPFPPSRFELQPEAEFRPSFRPDQVFADAGSPAFDISEPLQEVERIRKFFPETFIWANVTSRANGTAIFRATSPDSMTSWVLNGFAAHPTAGLGVAPNTATLTVFKSFFVNINLPTEVVQGEQIVIPAVVFNYLPSTLTVVVTLNGSSMYQSVVASRSGLEVLESGPRVQEITVKSGEQGVANFAILVTAIGVVDITITAQSTAAADGIRRQLVVKPPGAPVSFNYPIFISLDGQSPFNDSIDIPLPSSLVNGSDRARIQATGDPIGSSLNSLTSLIKLPTGCGEQTMVRNAPNLYIAQYLQAIGQFIGRIRDEIIAFLEEGYQRQLTYQRNDGGFSAFGNSDEAGSTWLTAYVIRVFFDVRVITFVDTAFLIRGADWLVERQNSDGSFNEFGKVLDSSIQGAGTGPGLTAFVALALLKVKPLATTDCTPDFECARVSRWGNATANAVGNLERLVDANSINDQLALAITSYALALANSSRAEPAFLKLQTFARREGGLLFWAGNSTITPGQTSEFSFWRPPRVQSRPLNILITSYAVLTLTAQNRITEAFPAVMWLTTQKNPYGGFVSSQDTSVALQALSAYATKTVNADTDIDIKVSSGATVLAEFSINNDNLLQLLIRELRSAPRSVTVAASGTGFAILEIIVQFNTDKQLSTPSFDVSTVLLDDNLDSFNLLVCTKWLWSRDSGMVVQEISIPSGFTPDLDSLGSIAGLRRTERRGNSVNVYFDRIGTTSVCYSIRMSRTNKVVRTQENYVITSAYYNPSDQSVDFFVPVKLRDSTVCEVCPQCCP